MLQEAALGKPYSSSPQLCDFGLAASQVGLCMSKADASSVRIGMLIGVCCSSIREAIGN